MSKSKTVYVLTKGNLFRFKHTRQAQCPRCGVNFEEGDMVATSATSIRYHYSCATKINLV